MGAIKDYLQILRHQHYINSVMKNENYKASRLEAEIIRNVHSIEKGLSLEAPRKLFGLKKIREMLNALEIYICLPEKAEEIVIMAISALKAYFDFHSDGKYLELNEIKKRTEDVMSKTSESRIINDCAWGGYFVHL